MKTEMLTHEKSFTPVRPLPVASLVSAAGWLALLLFAGLAAPVVTKAATIWNGSLVTFTQASPYPGTGDRHQLTANVALTLATPSGGGTGGIFNGVTETSFTKGFSPA